MSSGSKREGGGGTDATRQSAAELLAGVAEAAPLRVLLIDEESDRSRDVTAELEALGHTVIHQTRSAEGASNLYDRVGEATPDVVIIDMHSPDRDTLEDMRRITTERPKPIVMFVDESDSESIRKAVRAGVAAYVVKGSNPERVRPVLEVAIARFEEFQSLRSELERTRNSLADRKVIDRAKGLLMQRRGLSEEEAYKAIRTMAMNRSQRLVDVARTIVDMAEVL